MTSRGDLGSMYDTSSTRRLNNTYDEDELNEYRTQNGAADTTATPPSTPTRVNFIGSADDEKLTSRTPQIAADLYKR